MDINLKLDLEKECATNRHVCTAADPWTPEKGPRAEHPDAVDIDERDYGGGEYCVKYKCPYCGKTFEVELPQ